MIKKNIVVIMLTVILILFSGCNNPNYKIVETKDDLSSNDDPIVDSLIGDSDKVFDKIEDRMPKKIKDAELVDFDFSTSNGDVKLSFNYRHINEKKRYGTDFKVIFIKTDKSIFRNDEVFPLGYNNYNLFHLNSDEGNYISYELDEKKFNRVYISRLDPSDGEIFEEVSNIIITKFKLKEIDKDEFRSKYINNLNKILSKWDGISNLDEYSSSNIKELSFDYKDNQIKSKINLKFIYNQKEDILKFRNSFNSIETEKGTVYINDNRDKLFIYSNDNLFDGLLIEIDEVITEYEDYNNINLFENFFLISNKYYNYKKDSLCGPWERDNFDSWSYYDCKSGFDKNFMNNLNILNHKTKELKKEEKYVFKTSIGDYTFYLTDKISRYDENYCKNFIQENSEDSDCLELVYQKNDNDKEGIVYDFTGSYRRHTNFDFSQVIEDGFKESGRNPVQIQVILSKTDKKGIYELNLYEIQDKKLNY